MATANFEAQLQNNPGMFTTNELTYGSVSMCSSPVRADTAASTHAAGLPSPLLERRRMSRDDKPTLTSSAAANLAAAAVTPRPSQLQQSIMAGSLVDVTMRESPGLLTPSELQQLNGSGSCDSSPHHSASCPSPLPSPTAGREQPKVIQQHVHLQHMQPSRIPSPSHSYWRASRGGGSSSGEIPSRLPGQLRITSFLPLLLRSMHFNPFKALVHAGKEYACNVWGSFLVSYDMQTREW